ncbi:MAG: 16S rRNA (guanine(966)-N(2))-methyltransferase RsmD [Candidatus Melainabacteria bacterium]|nr:MAG: 16S rRNA (guanine(966)-N(2))-methyltransferase RsmD [Candidatus Melainabacteria bacterium]
MSIRITGGEARGRPVPSPSGKGVRPTASKMRQALFNILGSRTAQASFLDIFAGTGLIGLEALSRGAASLTAIEQNKLLAANIKVSAQQLGYKVEVVSGDFRRALSRLAGRKFDIIFADPPYEAKLEREILVALVNNNILQENGVLIIEHLSQCAIDCEGLPLRQVDRREYGQSAFTFYVYHKEQ